VTIVTLHILSDDMFDFCGSVCTPVYGFICSGFGVDQQSGKVILIQFFNYPYMATYIKQHVELNTHPLAQVH